MIATVRRTTTLAAAVLMSITLDGFVSHAGACQCPCWRDRKACVAKSLEQAHSVIVGKVISVRQVTRVQDDPLVVAHVAVQRVVKGDPPTKLVVESRGGDNGGNCGIGRSLLDAHQQSLSIALVLDAPSRSRYRINFYCNQVHEGELP